MAALIIVPAAAAWLGVLVLWVRSLRAYMSRAASPR